METDDGTDLGRMAEMNDITLLSIQKTSAMFLLSCQERYKLPQTAINFAVGSINSIVNNICDYAQASVQDVPDSNVSACLQLCRDPFSSLQTEYMQTKFYRTHFGLVVRDFTQLTQSDFYSIYCSLQEPVTIELGTSYHYKRSGSKRVLVEKRDTFQYVPLIENLEWILQNKSLRTEVSAATS